MTDDRRDSQQDEKVSEKPRKVSPKPSRASRGGRPVQPTERAVVAPPETR